MLNPNPSIGVEMISMSPARILGALAPRFSKKIGSYSPVRMGTMIPPLGDMLRKAFAVASMSSAVSVNGT
ncbi:unannotated protein [freshwater metagenome]|uniref:Unannotated protein n=1 Tax=freshwater metagenome TaxID=449393 RepID=A0A6J7AAL5_9ZZZZ